MVMGRGAGRGGDASVAKGAGGASPPDWTANRKENQTDERDEGVAATFWRRGVAATRGGA